MAMHAPKSRSWKSGFIKKGSAKVDLIDATNRLNLASHVGYRVSVSGTLTDREMQVRSVARHRRNAATSSLRRADQADYGVFRAAEILLIS